jgi:type III secretion protein V
VVEIHASLKGYLDPGRLWDDLERLIVRLEAQTGIPFPSFQVYFSGYLDPETFTLHLNEIPWTTGALHPGRLMVRESSETLEMLGIRDATPAANHSQGRPCHWVEESNWEILDRAEIPFLDNYRIILVQAERMMRKHGAEFLGLHETKMMLDQVEPMIEGVVKEAIRTMTLPRIAEVLQRLAREQISVRNIKCILETLVDWSAKEKDIVMLTEQVRVGLGRQISHWYGAGSNVIPAWALDGDLENLIRKSIKVNAAGGTLSLPPGVGEKLVDAIKSMREASAGAYPAPVLLAPLDVRRYVKILLEGELENQPVLSYQELPKDAVVHTLARVAV